MKKIRQAYNQMANHYAQAAVIQRIVSEHLQQRLLLLTDQPKLVVDLGAGIGELSLSLQRHFPNATVVSVDLAEQMLHQLQLANPVCADMSALPLLAQHVDLLMANLVLHWADDLNVVLQEIQRILRSDGVLLFSCPGPDTFSELRHCWQQLLPTISLPSLIDMHDLGDILQQQNFQQVVVDVQHFTVNYPTVDKIFEDLSQQALIDIILSAPEKKALADIKHAFVDEYQKFLNHDGQFPVTYEIIFGYARAPKQRQFGQEVAVPLDSIKRSKKE